MGRSPTTVGWNTGAGLAPAPFSGAGVGWVVLIGVLPLAELAFLTHRFDPSVLATRGGWLAHAVAASGDVVRAAVPLLAAAVLIGAARYRQLAPALHTALASPRRPWGALAGHLAGFAAVVWLGDTVFGDGEPTTGPLLAWIAAGAFAAVCWLVALLPGIARSGRAPLVAAAAAAGVGLLGAGAAAVTRDWWQPLGRSTVWTVYGLLVGLGYEVGAEPERFLVGTPRFVVEITPYCSGYQGIGLMWVFLGAYLALFRERLRFPRALWLLPIGTALAWILNAVRIAALVAIGHAGHEEIAVQGFHYHAGTLLFCATALGLGAWAMSSRAFGRTVAAPVGRADRATAAYVLPLVTLLATSLVTGAASSGGVDALYGVRVVTAAAVLWWYRRELAGAGWRCSWNGVGIGVVAFAVWVALAGTGADGDLGTVLARHDVAWRLPWIGFRTLGAVVIVPIVEELAFRGYLARRLTGAEFTAVPLERVTWPALAASSVLFGLMHRDVVAGAAVGILYGWAARRRGRLGDAVLAHGITNALLVAAVLLAGHLPFSGR